MAIFVETVLAAMLALARGGPTVEPVERETLPAELRLLDRLLMRTPTDDPERPSLLFRLTDELVAIGRVEQARRRLGAFATEPRWRGTTAAEHALHEYALLSLRSNDERAAMAARHRLGTDHPESGRLAELDVALADRAHARGDVPRALATYRRVNEHKGHRLHAYASYRIGWCHLEPHGTAEADPVAAVHHFVEAIEHARTGEATGGRTIRSKARRALARAFAEVPFSDPTVAWSAFRHWTTGPSPDEDEYVAVLEQLSQEYADVGRPREAIVVLRRLQVEMPGASASCRWQERAFRHARATGDHALQWGELEHLIALAPPKKSASHGADARACMVVVRDTVREAARIWHIEADHSADRKLFELAERAYSSYLRLAPAAPDAYAMAYHQAELTWSLAHVLDEGPSRIDTFLRAHDRFVRVLQMKPDRRYAKAAAIGQLLSLERALPPGAGAERPSANYPEATLPERPPRVP